MSSSKFEKVWDFADQFNEEFIPIIANPFVTGDTTFSFSTLNSFDQSTVSPGFYLTEDWPAIVSNTDTGIGYIGGLNTLVYFPPRDMLVTRLLAKLFAVLRVTAYTSGTFRIGSARLLIQEQAIETNGFVNRILFDVTKPVTTDNGLVAVGNNYAGFDFQDYTKFTLKKGVPIAISVTLNLAGDGVGDSSLDNVFWGTYLISVGMKTFYQSGIKLEYIDDTQSNRDLLDLRGDEFK